MADALIVLLKTLALFLVILVGWAARRRRCLSGETAATISRFVVDFTFPALVFSMMIKTVDAQSLAVTWYFPLIGIGVLVIGEAAGLATMGLFARRGVRPTFVFLVAVANWVYLPLPILEGLYGDRGVSAVLLFNVGAQVFLWTVAVWTLQGGRPDRRALLRVATNPGLIAAVAGILVALAWPAARTLHDVPAAAPFGLRLLGTGVTAVAMLGSLTVPLSLVVTGAHLGGLKLAHHKPTRAFTGVLLARLVLTPLATVGGVALLGACGVVMPEIARMTAYIIAAMPVAVSCSIFTERFGGDTPLAARTIFYSTFLGIATMPAFIILIRWLGW